MQYDRIFNVCSETYRWPVTSSAWNQKKTQKVVIILKNKDPVGETVTERVSGVSPEGEKKR